MGATARERNASAPAISEADGPQPEPTRSERHPDELPSDLSSAAEKSKTRADDDGEGSFCPKRRPLVVSAVVALP